MMRARARLDFPECQQSDGDYPLNYIVVNKDSGGRFSNGKPPKPLKPLPPQHEDRGYGNWYRSTTKNAEESGSTTYLASPAFVTPSFDPPTPPATSVFPSDVKSGTVLKGGPGSSIALTGSSSGRPSELRAARSMSHGWRGYNSRMTTALKEYQEICSQTTMTTARAENFKAKVLTELADFYAVKQGVQRRRTRPYPGSQLRDEEKALFDAAWNYADALYHGSWNTSWESNCRHNSYSFIRYVCGETAEIVDKRVVI